MKSSKELKQSLESDLKLENEHLIRWINRFKEDPSDAFEWSDDAYRSAARIRVSEHLLRLINKGVAADLILKVVTELVERGARYPERSTSIGSNHIEREITAAYAFVLNQYLKEE